MVYEYRLAELQDMIDFSAVRVIFFTWLGLKRGFRRPVSDVRWSDSLIRFRLRALALAVSKRVTRPCSRSSSR